MAVAVAALLAVSGCGSDSSETGASGGNFHRVEGERDARRGDPGRTVDVPAEAENRDVPPLDDGGGEPSVSGLGHYCEGHDDCGSDLFCVTGPDGSICSMLCVESCPSGWSCKGVEGLGADIMFLCVPTGAGSCAPCGQGETACPPPTLCSATNNSKDDKARRCLPQCAGPGARCPADTVCKESDDGTAYVCRPDPGTLCCAAATEGVVEPCRRENTHGRCEGNRRCDGRAGWARCDAPEPEAERCNLFDDDCDGDVDEELPGCACGDGECKGEAGEDALTCPCDCAACGDGVCSPCGESPARCGVDCCRSAEGTSGCGDGYCLGYACNESPQTCPEDCGTACGNGTCDRGESSWSCLEDCKKKVCGNGVCEGSDGGPDACPQDCASFCGDCKCEPERGETGFDCPIDCGYCGDGECSLCRNLNETEESCREDCCRPKTEICNDIDDDCDGETDEDTCDDGDPCTRDLCDSETGTCSHEPLTGNDCDDGVVCTVGDTCAEGVCEGERLEGCCASDEECPDDEDLCNGIPFCDSTDPKPVNWRCRPVAGTPVVCDPSGDTECVRNLCDPADGTCSRRNLPAETACDDQNPCTHSDSCGEGLCVGVVLPGCCSRDADCEDDGDVCNGIPRCDQADPNPSNWACVHDEGSLVTCDTSQDTPCKVTTCQPADGSCVQATLNDGDICTHEDPCIVDSSCQLGVCTGVPKLCDDGRDCSFDSCDATTGECVFVRDPGAVEVPGEGGDQDCDGLEICFVDEDGDGWRPDAESTVLSPDGGCTGEGEAPASAPVGDCDDGDSDVHPDAGDEPDAAFTDANCDGVDGVVEELVFVAAGAAPGGDGTPEKPLANLAEALILAAPAGRDVALATGDYSAPLSLEDGVSIHGGYDASAGWAQAAEGSHTRIVHQGGGGGRVVGVYAHDIAEETLLHRLRVKAGDATAPGASVYGVHAMRAPGLVLRLVLVEAGNGAAGAKGASGSPGKGGNTGGRGGDGEDDGPIYGGDGDPGGGGNGAPGVSECGVPSGGKGGRGGAARRPGYGGDESTDATCGGGGGAEGRPGKTGGTGCAGAEGSPGRLGDGGESQTSLGADGFWSGAPGKAGGRGARGKSGGGGGGGGGENCNWPSCRPGGGSGGGGGGSGGCGGTGGQGGTAGGGSFALVAVASDGLRVEASTLDSGRGGRGGDGGGGGSGGTGGPGGAGGSGYQNEIGAGGNGGAGGDGGAGGAGGGGAGGPSTPLMCANSVVRMAPDVKLQRGLPGAGGEGPGRVGQAGFSLPSRCDSTDLFDHDGDGWCRSGYDENGDGDCADGDVEAYGPEGCKDCKDCLEFNAAVHPLATEACDGWATGCAGGSPFTTEEDEIDGDGDGFLACTGFVDNKAGLLGGSDCDPAEPTVYPGAPERVFDGVDQDCDERDLCFHDKDDDGFLVERPGTLAVGAFGCDDPFEGTPDDPRGDCDDGDDKTYPNAHEVPGDQKDQSCDGKEVCYVDGDNDGARLSRTVVSADSDCRDNGESPASEPIDCCDKDNRVRPGQRTYYETARACGGFDYNCDGGESKGSTSSASCTFKADSNGCSWEYGWLHGIPGCGREGTSVKSWQCDTANKRCHPPETEKRIQSCR